ncbi:hypothetical protein pipiens_000998, partial [Culex pipiens pipiens]
ERTHEDKLRVPSEGSFDEELGSWIDVRKSVRKQVVNISVVHRPSGLAEAHRLLAQVALRRWPSGTRQEEEHEEGLERRRRCRGGGGRLSFTPPPSAVRTGLVFNG